MTELTSNSSHIIPIQSQELLDDSFNDSNDDAINMLFMFHEMLFWKMAKELHEK